MAEIVANFGAGIMNVMTPTMLFMLFVGLMVGLIAGVLPGLTLMMGIILVLPFTYSMDTTQAIVLLTAIYLAGNYGGAFTSILFKIPGEPMHVPLLWDGYSMARHGMASKALGWTLVASLGGGLASGLLMVFVSEPFAKIALDFSTPEYFAIVLFGMSGVVVLGTKSVSRAVISLGIGLLIAVVGIDDIFGAERFTFGISILADGIDYLTVMVGAYAVAEVLGRIEEGFNSPSVQQMGQVKTNLPSWAEMKAKWASFARGISIGSFIGAAPGAGAVVAAFVAYGVEKQTCKGREAMGSGMAEGIIAPQSSAVASVGGAMLHLLTLGIPGSGATAIILGAFMLHGIQPGPQIFVSNPDMVYTIYGSFFVGLLLMCLVGYLAVKPLVKVLDYPEAVVSAFVMVLCFLGAFTIRNSITDLWMMIVFSILGVLMAKYNFPVAPMVLGTILGPLAERNFMTSMISFSNDWTVFFTRPVSGFVMVVTILTLLGTVCWPLWKQYRHNKPAATN